MCEGGVNAGQMQNAISMVDDQIALAQKWLEELHHSADHGHRHEVSAELAQVTVILGQAREKVQTAINLLDTPTDDITIERV